MTVNVGLLQKTLETIKANPTHWNQKNWHCNSSHCFAGFTELLYFGLPIYSNVETLRKDERIYDPIALHEDFSWGTRNNATNALGLTVEDATLLFAGGNTLADIESMVVHLVKFENLINWDYEANDDY